jgi:NitT/TauT family transport system permease protein
MSEAVLGRAGRLADSALLLGAAIVAWQVLFEYVGDVALTPPWRTLENAAQLMATSRFWEHAGATLSAFAYALALSAAIGIAGGLALGFHRFSGEVAEPILAALYTIPKVTLYPLMLLVFGLGQPAKVAFGVIHGVIPIILFTMAAVKTMNPVYAKMARILRLSPWQTATTVLMPAVAPEIFTGLRVGFSLTLLGVLIGEMFASQRGLGFLIINGINSHNVRVTTAVILIVIIVALLANTALLALDRRVHRRG